MAKRDEYDEVDDYDPDICGSCGERIDDCRNLQEENEGR